MERRSMHPTGAPRIPKLAAIIFPPARDDAERAVLLRLWHALSAPVKP